ncbi:hypothetical protein GW835_02425 [archaeon]|nr:hypothetical protein [archaeon]NCP79403.1 hypothetical protein [archaeon]NCP97346.1 hypothetical protein [archaeon]NCQ07170.1 hypothetical protein [archaeon]NCQ50966.1 hypothetical protein [archaeon]
MAKSNSLSKNFLVENFNPRYKEKKPTFSSRTISILSEVKSEQLFLRNFKQAKEEYSKIKKELNPVFEKRKKENLAKFNDYLSLERTSVKNLLDFLSNNDQKIRRIKNMIESRTKYSSDIKLNKAQQFYLKYLNLMLRKSDQLLYYLKEMKAIHNLPKSKELPKRYSDKIDELKLRLKKMSHRKRYLLEEKDYSLNFLSNNLPNLKSDYKLKAAGEGKEIINAENHHESQIKNIDSQLSDIETNTLRLKKRIEELTKQGHEENLRSFISQEKKKIPVLKKKFKEKFPDFITLYQIFMEERNSIEEKFYIDLYLNGKLSNIK